MNLKKARQALARVIAGEQPRRARGRQSELQAEIIPTSRELYALEHKQCSRVAASFCENMGPRMAEITARYEAVQWSPDRTSLQGYVQDADKDSPQGTQREFMRLMRWFEKNSPPVQKILDLVETNVVGAGLIPAMSSDDVAWNKAALAWLTDWFNFCDLGQRVNFMNQQALIVRAMAVDGEIFVQKTYDPANGRPRTVLIEAHRITSGGVQKTEAMRDLIDIDGILLDRKTARPKFYIVQSAGSVNAQVLPASEVVHFYEPSRAGQYRGITLFHAVANTLHDLSDLQKFEMQAAKAASVIADIIYTATGEAPDSAIGGGTELLEGLATADKPQYYAKQFGASTRILQSGDKHEQTVNTRTSQQTRDTWNYLERQIAKGVGISAAALLDYEGAWGGASLRAAVACDNRFYNVRSSALTAGLTEIVNWALGWAIAEGDSPELKGFPRGWNKPRWQPPRRATVDIGRESSAIINELKAGIRTYKDTYAEAGLDATEQLTQRADEAALIYKLADERGISAQAIASLDAGERNAAIQSDAILEKQASDTGAMDAAATPEDSELVEKVQPALIDKIGIGGTQALISILQQVSTGVLPREQGIATVKLLFGITSEEAASMVPSKGTAEPIADAQNIPTA